MKKNLLLIAFIVITSSVIGQTNDSINITGFTDYDQPRSYIIADITITGLKFLQPNYLVNISGLSVGEEINIPGDEIIKAIDKFWSFGLFSDVKILLTKVDGKNAYLNIQLTEQPRLSKARISGLNKNDTKDIEDKIKLKPGSQVTANIINNTKTIINKVFNDKGFLNCKVDITEKADTARDNKVFLDINVDKGKHVRIKKIDFTGNTAYTDHRLKRTFKKTHEYTFNIFKASKFIESKYKEDKKKLLEFYSKNGYRDIAIQNEDIKKINTKRIELDINLREGIKYYIRNITWVGNTKYPSEYLDRVLGMKKGDVYNQKLLDERLYTDEDAVSSIYMDDGYLFFTVEPVEADIEGDSIDLEMRISESKQATVNRVIIKGNTKTNEHVVRREIRTRPGQLFSKSDIIRSVRELASLGHFNPENITPNPLPNPLDGTVDLEYSLEERPNDQLEVSGGWGYYGFVGTIGIKFGNFSARNILNAKSWRPVPTGDGQTLSVSAQSNGKYYQSYNLSFVEPWFGGKKPNSFSFSLYHSTTKSTATSTTDTLDHSNDFFKVSGASIGLGHKLTWPDDYFMLYTELGYQRYHLNNWGTNFIINNGFSNVIDLKISLSRSSQDQLIYPRRGSVFSLSLQLTPPYSLFKKKDFWALSANEEKDAEDYIKKLYPEATNLETLIQNEITYRQNSKKYKFIEYHKWNFSGAWYTSIAGNLVLALKTEFGYLGYYNAGIGTSPFEKFTMGGSGMYGYNLYGTDVVALRGYFDGTVTPQKNGIDNGNIYVKHSLELRYPFSLSPSATVYGLAFLEAGNCWQTFNEFNPFILKRSAGIGVRAFLPMFGMLGVDWGFGFDIPNSGTTVSQDIKKGYHGGEFHFIMGQQF